jgi:hypothetical protein
MSTDTPSARAGDQVTVTICDNEQHIGKVGRVTTVGAAAIRVQLADGSICWPTAYELVAVE